MKTPQRDRGEPEEGAAEPLGLELAVPPLAAAAAVREAAELWDAQLQELNAGAFRVSLPVAAGLRNGLVQAVVRVERGADARSSRVRLRVEQEAYRLQPAAVMILAFAALGGLAATLWPFFPGGVMMTLAPIGILLALAGWFLVTSRLITRNERDFLDLIDQLAEDIEHGEPLRSGGRGGDGELPPEDALAGVAAREPGP